MNKEYDFSKGKRGAVIASAGKTRITIMLDDDVLEAFRKKEISMPFNPPSGIEKLPFSSAAQKSPIIFFISLSKFI